MTDADRERLRSVFGENAEGYDRCRPGYPVALFERLVELAGLGPGCRVLEIGCGTGQATTALAELGCTVLAVELSEAMAALARRRLASFPGVEVVAATFEDWPLPAAPFDVVLAATSFHWLDPAVRMDRAADALRPGGVLAVIHSEHVRGGSTAFFVDAQRCYGEPEPPPPADTIPRDSGEFDASGRFGEVRFDRYEWTADYTERQYLDLLSTYSGHRVQPAARRAELDACLHGLFVRHGGTVTKAYLTQLATARALPGPARTRPV